MKKFLSVVCLAALFVGCGSEANAEQCPSWQTSRDRSGVNLITLQSNDDIIIKNMTINRGNCSYKNKFLIFYELDLSKVAIKEQREEVEAHNKWLKTAKKYKNGFPMIAFKDGSTLVDLLEQNNALSGTALMLSAMSGNAVPFLSTFGTSKKKTEDEKMFEKLDELSKGAFITNSYLMGETFSFGERISFSIDCNYKDVIEVRLETNLGECVLPINR
nr:hypothetical protein [uncultured Campylobacter sp.]